MILLEKYYRGPWYARFCYLCRYLRVSSTDLSCFVEGYNVFIPWVPYIVPIRNNTAYQYVTTKFLIVPYLLCCCFLFLSQRITSIWLDTSFLVLISLIPADAQNLGFCSLSCNMFFDSH